MEEGLVGKGAQEFAGTFESQREHFNKHKQLERSIKESEKIKAEIESYVTSFSMYNQKVKEYEAKKKRQRHFGCLLRIKKHRQGKNLQPVTQRRNN